MFGFHYFLQQKKDDDYGNKYNQQLAASIPLPYIYLQ